MVGGWEWVRRMLLGVFARGFHPPIIAPAPQAVVEPMRTRRTLTRNSKPAHQTANAINALRSLYTQHSDHERSGACRIFPGFSSLTFDGPWQNGSVKQARGKSNRVDTVQSGWVEFCSQEACYHQKGDNPPGDDHADSNYLWVTCQERT